MSNLQINKVTLENRDKIFATLVNEYNKNVRLCSQTKSLEEVENYYTNIILGRDEIYDLIYKYFDNTSVGDNVDKKLADFNTMEIDLFNSYPIPCFDTTLNIFDLFSDYEPYFQRYGCMFVDNIISWNESEILFHDYEMDDYEMDIIEIIPRPDVLMHENE